MLEKIEITVQVLHRSQSLSSLRQQISSSLPHSEITLPLHVEAPYSNVRQTTRRYIRIFGQRVGACVGGSDAIIAFWRPQFQKPEYDERYG